MLAPFPAVNLSGCGECKPLAGSSHCLPEQFDSLSLANSLNMVVVVEVSPLPLLVPCTFFYTCLTWQRTKDDRKEATKDAQNCIHTHPVSLESFFVFHPLHTRSNRRRLPNSTDTLGMHYDGVIWWNLFRETSGMREIRER